MNTYGTPFATGKVSHSGNAHHTVNVSTKHTTPHDTSNTKTPFTDTLHSCFFTAHLEALAMHDARTGLVILFLRNPHLLERRERRQNRPSNPH